MPLALVAMVVSWGQGALHLTNNNYFLEGERRRVDTMYLEEVSSKHQDTWPDS